MSDSDSDFDRPATRNPPPVERGDALITLEEAILLAQRARVLAQSQKDLQFPKYQPWYYMEKDRRERANRGRAYHL